ncbi:hypothetical protein H5410_011544 [Solanum commersonii]|uniref:Uncharacterized protein n=1 Tax=Solanum commersonii TaxID=4109 RepID=A0A9J6ANZ7_SOLCO|nr:hypothetical protein H5410_011544 [Solanum commersonii]
MKSYTILCCFCRKKKKTHSVTRNVTGGSPAIPPPPKPLQANRDVEKGEIKPKDNSAIRDGGMVILGAAAAATVVTAAVIDTAYNGGGSSGGCGSGVNGDGDGGGCGGEGGGCGGGGCGGGGCGAVVLVWYFGGRKENISQNNVSVPAPPDVEKAVVTDSSARRDWGIRGWGGGGMSSWGGGGGGTIGVGARGEFAGKRRQMIGKGGFARVFLRTSDVSPSILAVKYVGVLQTQSFRKEIQKTILSCDSGTENDKTLEKDDKLLQTAMLKKRYANMIISRDLIMYINVVLSWCRKKALVLGSKLVPCDQIYS